MGPFVVAVFWLTAVLLYRLLSGSWPLVLRLHTTQFNSAATSLRAHHPHVLRLLRSFYTIGAICGLVGMLSALSLLLANPVLVARSWSRGGAAQAERGQLLAPVVPGLTVPFDLALHLILAIALSGFVHEAGHACAAAAEGLELTGAGCFLALLVYPGFYVDITERVRRLPSWRALRVFAAGAWHNFVLCVVCALLLAAQHFLLFPLFIVHPGGAVVLSIPSHSPLVDTDVVPGDIITAVDACPTLKGSDSWKTCLLDRVTSPPPLGYCIPAADPAMADITDDFLLAGWVAGGTNATVKECCAMTYTGKGQCFTLTRPGHSPVLQYCLDARKVVESNDGRCRSAADCSSRACVLPVLEEGWSIAEVHVSKKRSILFAGTPIALWQAVTVGDFKARVRFPGVDRIPDIVHTFLFFTLSVSGGIGVLNLAPVFWLDGEWILSALFPGSSRWVRIFETFCTVLLAFNIVLGFVVTAARMLS